MSVDLHARMPGFSRDMLDEAMCLRKSLVRIRCMRNTMFILPREIVPAAFAAMKKRSGLNAERFCKQRGLDEDEFETVARKIVALLASGGKTTAEIKRAVRPVTNLPAVLTLLCDRGILARGETPGWRSNAYRYHLFDEYLPGLDLNRLEESEGLRLLIRFYLSAFGPATVEDIAWWLGTGKAIVNKALADLPVECIEVQDIVGDLVLLRDEVESLRNNWFFNKPVINFLPGMDPYIMGYKVRERYLDKKDVDFVFDRSGNSAPTVLIDGRVAGVWDYSADCGSIIKVYLFKDTDPKIVSAISAHARRTGAFITGADVQFRQCRSMVPLTQRTVGAVMAPLKGQ